MILIDVEMPKDCDECKFKEIVGRCKKEYCPLEEVECWNGCTGRLAMKKGLFKEIFEDEDDDFI